MTDIRRPRQSSSEHGGIGAKGQSRDHQLEETYRASGATCAVTGLRHLPVFAAAFRPILPIR